MNSTTILRVITITTVLGFIGLVPKDVEAQCAVSYNDSYNDGSTVSGWNDVSDYYNGGCNPGWTDFTHSYYSLTVVSSPSGRQASNSNTTYQYGGGGSTGSYAFLDIQDEAGDFVSSTTATIYCSIAGLVYQATQNQTIKPWIQLYTTSQSTSEVALQGGRGVFTAYVRWAGNCQGTFRIETSAAGPTGYSGGVCWAPGGCGTLSTSAVSDPQNLTTALSGSENFNVGTNTDNTVGGSGQKITATASLYSKPSACEERAPSGTSREYVITTN